MLVVTLLANVLLDTFGATLAGYIGGGTVAATGDGSVMSEEACLAEGRDIDTRILEEGAVLLRN